MFRPKLRFLNAIYNLCYNFISSLRWSPPRHFSPLLVDAIILNKNYYSNLPPLVSRFKKAGIDASNIFIVDLASTSPHVFATYNILRSQGVEILEESDIPFGPWIIWHSDDLSSRFLNPKRLILVTDSDISIPDDLPSDWLYQMYKALRSNPFISKTALPLRTSDIDVIHAFQVRLHELSLKTGIWRRLLSFPSRTTFQGTDTTIALYKPFRKFNYYSLRLSDQYEVIHLPWYSNFLNSSEYQFYRSCRNNMIGDWHL